MSPLPESGEEGGVLLLEGEVLSEERGGHLVALVDVEEGPGGVVVHGGVELPLVVVESQGASVHSQDISNSSHNWQVFKSLSIQHHIGVITSISSLLLVFEEQSGVYHFQ